MRRALALLLLLPGCALTHLNDVRAESDLGRPWDGRLQVRSHYVGFDTAEVGHGPDTYFARVGTDTWQGADGDFVVEGATVRGPGATLTLSEDAKGWRVEVARPGDVEVWLIQRAERAAPGPSGRVLVAEVRGPRFERLVGVELKPGVGAQGLPWPQVGLALLSLGEDAPRSERSMTRDAATRMGACSRAFGTNCQPTTTR